jgi:hypothetical protein
MTTFQAFIKLNQNFSFNFFEVSETTDTSITTDSSITTGEKFTYELSTTTLTTYSYTKFNITSKIMAKEKKFFN